MNKKCKEVYRKIANISDEELARQMIAKRKSKPLQVRRTLHRIGIHQYLASTVLTDRDANMSVRKCKICGMLAIDKLRHDISTILHCVFFALVLLEVFIVFLCPFPSSLLAIPLSTSLFYWFLKTVVEDFETF